MEDADYAFHRGRAEYERLTEQAEIFGPLTGRMLRSAGIQPGMRVLDIGCGAGDVSFLVSALVGPEVRSPGWISTAMPSVSPSNGAPR